MKLKEMYTKLYQQYEDAQEMNVCKAFELRRIQHDCYTVMKFIDLQDQLTAGYVTQDQLTAGYLPMENDADKDPFYGLAKRISHELTELCQTLYSSFPRIYDDIESMGWDYVPFEFPNDDDEEEE